jgi:hypothetical protein
MLSGEGMWLSRMRENLMSGSLGGRWKRGGPTGHLRVPGRCAENATTMAWSGPNLSISRYRASALPDLAMAFN